MEINIFDLEEAKKMAMASLNVVITGVSRGLGRALIESRGDDGGGE